MQLEIKMLLSDTSDYHRLTGALNPLFVSEESYVDYFFDFRSGALTEESSVLRLRVPCVKPASLASPTNTAPAAAAVAAAPAFTNGGEGCSIASQRAAAAAGMQNEHIHLSQQPPSYQYSNRANVTATQAARLDDFSSGGGGGGDGLSGKQQQQPYGKLIFKQKNTVQKGHQMNFVVEDKRVPPEVVARLTAGQESPFDVLFAYAQFQESCQQQQQAAAGSAISAIGRIVDRLQYTAQRLQENAGGSNLNVSQDSGNSNTNDSMNGSNHGGGGVGRGGDDLNMSQEAEESNRYYGNMRYASATASQPRPPGEQAERRRSIRCDLVPMGSYSSIRKLYRYLQPRQARRVAAAAAVSASASVASVNTGGGGSAAALAMMAGGLDGAPLTAEEQQELEWRGRLCIRVDKTLYPFGEKYELEVPSIDDGGLIDDIAAELCKFLTSLQVKFMLGSEGKYARFICGIRSLQAFPTSVQDVKLRLTNANGFKEVKANLERLMGSSSLSSSSFLSLSGGGGGESKRSIANLDLDTSGTQGQDVNDALLAYTGSTEQLENFFFDGLNGELASQRCYLRLRRVNQSGRYMLVLKEDNTFTDGAQMNQTSKMALSEDVALALMEQPGSWLLEQHEHNAVAHAVWSYFGLRTLLPTAYFTTERITVPWWNARAQRATVRKPTSASSSSIPATTAPGAFLQQQQQQSYHSTSSGSGGLGLFTQADSFTQLHSHLSPHQGGGVLVVPPLLIHLDRSNYRIPVTNKSRQQRTPFSQFTLASQQQQQQHASSGGGGGGAGATPEAFYELYEMEVTNVATAAPSTVIEELTAVLDGMGVEWQTGIQSKLDQYYTLVRTVNE